MLAICGWWFGSFRFRPHRFWRTEGDTFTSPDVRRGGGTESTEHLALMGGVREPSEQLADLDVLEVGRNEAELGRRGSSTCSVQQRPLTFGEIGQGQQLL